MNFPVELEDWTENPEAREDGNLDRDVYGLQPFYPLPAVRVNAILELRSMNSRRRLEALDVLLSRYRRVLALIAYRVLGNHEEAEDAVQNCIRVASDRAPRFDHEGAFRSWLARVLIDEAVTILYKQSRSTRGSGNHDRQSSLEPANQQRNQFSVDAAFYCSSAKAASVIAVTPVRRVSSGSGAKKGECGEGSATPVCSLSATFAGS